ncbi:SUMF1/EgtB/PvdO family nonheme iron enzyme [Thalassomonas viridans]|nr:SUMF1/EgtB/PvdO family nonheme iron enzyme [Thalassomonas viridans]
MNEFDKNIKAAQTKSTTLYILLGAGLGILLVGYLFWLMLAQGFAIKVSPEEALKTKRLAVVQGTGLVLGDSAYSFGGKLVVNVDADKFEPQDITLTSESPSTVEVVLEPSPGSLAVNTAPANEQTAWSINNELVHVGSELQQALPPGEYALQVENKFYQPVQQKLSIASEQETRLEIDFTPVQGSIAIKSTPSGAEVSINGESAGQTPLSLAAKGGAYEVTVAKEGYELLTDKVEITHTDENGVRNYLLQPKKAIVSVTATPQDGTLVISGKAGVLGDNAIAANRSHSLLYERDGYYPFSQSLNLQPGEVKALTINLKPEIGKVAIASTPAADIYINGVLEGSGAITRELPALPQTIAFKKPGYRSITKTITPSGSKVSKVKVELLTEFDARRREGRPLYADTLGIELAKFNMTPFTMGSPANEKGRRRNEHQVPVSFSRPVWVSRHEITEAQFRKFSSSRSNSSSPVTDVSWNDAALYCNWLSEQEGLPPFYRVSNGRVSGFNKGSRGYRLPTEAEWEWLAKMAKRATPTVYVWGDFERIPKEAGNFADASLKGKQTFVLKKYNDSFVDKAPVGSFRSDRIGMFDLAGNVSEWVNDFYTNLPPKGNSTRTDYMGSSRGKGHVYKGGNFKTGRLSNLRASFRESSDGASDTIGFRIARYE